MPEPGRQSPLAPVRPAWGASPHRHPASLAMAMGVLLSAASVHAHNEQVHQDMTALAFDTMKATQRLVKDGVCPLPGLRTSCPLGVSPVRTISNAQWQDWLHEVSRAAEKLSLQPNDLPQPKAGCRGSTDPDFPSRPMFQLSWAPSVEYGRGGGCGEREHWKSGGIFNVPSQGEVTGAVLGYHASTPDYLEGDWALWVRPTSGLVGAGTLKSIASDAWQAGIGAIVLPFFCAVDCIFGDCKRCDEEAREFARDSDPVSNLEGFLPGVPLPRDSMFIGLGHHINMEPSASNEFDDRQGLYLEEAGPGGVLDVIEVVALAMADLTGTSVNHDESHGPLRYQVDTGHDGHPETLLRSASQWQFETLGHVPFTPVDNLAFYGWQRFRDDPAHPTSALGWPLHAIGDATAPHHVIGTFGWGHRPFEDAQARLWPRIRHQRGEAYDDAKDATEAKEQLEQAIQILLHGYIWRQEVVAWRKVRGGGVDLPIRELVTKLASNTQVRLARDPLSDWPLNPAASTQYLVDEGGAISAYVAVPNAAARVEPYFVDGMGATLSFLVSASEVLP